MYTPVSVFHVQQSSHNRCSIHTYAVSDFYTRKFYKFEFNTKAYTEYRILYKKNPQKKTHKYLFLYNYTQTELSSIKNTLTNVCFHIQYISIYRKYKSCLTLQIADSLYWKIDQPNYVEQQRSPHYYQSKMQLNCILVARPLPQLNQLLPNPNSIVYSPAPWMISIVQFQKHQLKQHMKIEWREIIFV